MKPSASELRLLYESGMTQREIADIYGCADTTILRWMRAADIPVRSSYRQRPFWDKVAIGPGCWEWQGRRNFGYGYRINTQTRRQEAVHRTVWEQIHGPIPDGLFVCHRCDNPPCVRPDHLFLGTHLDNVADMVTKGRSRWINRKGRPVRGSRHSQAKLTEADVLIIRQRLAVGEADDAISRDYGVSPDAVSLIRRGKTWAWLRDAA
jgi:hypothetical protein